MSKVSYFYLLLFFGCVGESDYKAFIKLHGEDDFGSFLNTSIYFRSLDAEGNALYFISFTNDKCDAPYIVTVDRESNNPVRLDSKLRDKNCKAQDSVRSEKVLDITKEFLRYRIRHLKVDSDSIVFVSLSESEYPKLVKLPSMIQNSKVKNFSRLRKFEKNWYLLER